MYGFIKIGGLKLGRLKQLSPYKKIRITY